MCWCWVDKIQPVKLDLMLGFRRWSHVRRRDQKASFCVSGPLSGPLICFLIDLIRGIFRIIYQQVDRLIEVDQ